MLYPTSFSDQPGYCTDHAQCASGRQRYAENLHMDIARAYDFHPAPGVADGKENAAQDDRNSGFGQCVRRNIPDFKKEKPCQDQVKPGGDEQIMDGVRVGDAKYKQHQIQPDRIPDHA